MCTGVFLYLLLFLSAFGSATLLPMQSELVLSGLLLQHREQAVALLVVASVGNTLGSMLNWWLGLNMLRLQHYRWFPFKATQLDKAQQVYGRYGYWSLLLSWVPVLGDPLTLIAGIMKEPLWRFVLIVALAKTARYVAVVLTVLSV